MGAQPGFFDGDHRMKRLSDLGDQLEAFGSAVDFEIFRGDLVLALARSENGQGGRPPFDPVMMFKILVIQAANNLSDERTEFLINDRLSFMRFLGLGLSDRVPDARTIWTCHVAKMCNAIAIADGERRGEVRFLGAVDASEQSMRRLIQRIAAKHERVHFCYEAGPTGYGLHRLITSLGHPCMMVLAPSLIPRESGDRVKTNRFLRWLQEQQFEHPAQQIALQEMVESVRTSKERVERLEAVIEGFVPTWSLGPVCIAGVARSRSYRRRHICDGDRRCASHGPALLPREDTPVFEHEGTDLLAMNP